ncbi:MAG: helix-turn-helix domain-containing protein [Chloroflexota bacterium]|jgi:DNA-binding HxlR family transcriptional regulator
MAKTYGQFCGLARALDHIGDRWTLLIIRELLIAPAGFGSLQTALAGIPTNLLADRLRRLEADGLIERARDETDGRRLIYKLSEVGSELEPAIMSLIAWGRHWMRAGQGDDRFQPGWGKLALRALLAARPSTAQGSVVVSIDGCRTTVVAEPDRALEVVAAEVPQPNATVSARAEVLLGLIAGELSLTEARRQGLQLEGDVSLAAKVLVPPSG